MKRQIISSFRKLVYKYGCNPLNWKCLYNGRKCAVFSVPSMCWGNEDALACVDTLWRRGVATIFVRKELVDMATPFELRSILTHEFGHVAVGHKGL
jgi:hypothetical protein